MVKDSAHTEAEDAFDPKRVFAANVSDVSRDAKESRILSEISPASRKFCWISVALRFETWSKNSNRQTLVTARNTPACTMIAFRVYENRFMETLNCP